MYKFTLFILLVVLASCASQKKSEVDLGEHFKINGEKIEYLSRNIEDIVLDLKSIEEKIDICKGNECEVYENALEEVKNVYNLHSDELNKLQEEAQQNLKEILNNLDSLKTDSN